MCCMRFPKQLSSKHLPLAITLHIPIHSFRQTKIFLCEYFRFCNFPVAIIFFLLYQRFWMNRLKLFLNFCLIVALSTYDQDQSYKYDMLCAFNPSPIEINSNGGLKWEHLESSLQQLKSLYLDYHTQCLLLPKLTGWWLTMRGSHPKNNTTLWSRSVVRSHGKLKLS